MRPGPLLFILDEPTASLDAPSEHEIFVGYARRARALAVKSGAVTVIVSHRFSTIAMADHILVMSDGRITEAGDHRTLMEKEGLYAELYRIHEKAYADRP
jgi:ATP-binding cassette subfamily B protein